MYEQQTELSYRRTALAGASSIGLVIALYDTLSGNLRRAASAITNNDIEKRCAEVNHALLVVGQLESMVDKSSGTELAGNLSLFYAHLRAKMMEASARKSSPLLEEQVALVLQVRTAWQQRETGAPETAATHSFPVEPASSSYAERPSFSQSV